MSTTDILDMNLTFNCWCYYIDHYIFTAICMNDDNACTHIWKQVILNNTNLTTTLHQKVATHSYKKRNLRFDIDQSQFYNFFPSNEYTWINILDAQVGSADCLRWLDYCVLLNEWMFLFTQYILTYLKVHIYH